MSLSPPEIAAPAWLAELHQRGAARFEQLGWPRRDDEYWRHTNFSPIAKTDFTPALNTPLAPESIEIHRFAPGEFAAELIFHNGFAQPHLSHIPTLPGITLKTLDDADLDPALLERHLAHLAPTDDNPFVALNTAQFRDGAVLHLRRGVKIDKPIHLIFFATTRPGQPASINHPRLLIVAEEGAQATIVETYAGDAAGGVYFTNAVTELSAGPGSRIDYCRLQRDDLRAYHVSHLQVELAARANFVSHAATIGGKLTRNNLNVVLNGERAEATLNGLVIARDHQHVDNHTLMHHEKAHCPSHELYKHVLSDQATCVFKGKIFVQKDAQKTDSKQNSKSLLLSDGASMNSQPALEIYADDVKCTHGSTTGPVDEEAVFYLRSRGVSLEAARHLLSYAFAADITRRIKVVPVRDRLEDFLAAQHGLPQDLRITDLGAHDEKAR